MKDYERKLGSDEIIYLDQAVIDKQRAVAGYLIKNIGLNLIKGKSIMNISLPINIFDTRSTLELYYNYVKLVSLGKVHTLLPYLNKLV
jgi:hypothetical protein